MKILLTHLLGLCIIFNAYSQTQKKKLLFIAAKDAVDTIANTSSKNDAGVITYLKTYYEVKVRPINAQSDTVGYDVVYISEEIGSADPGVSNYRRAPMPMVINKVHALKQNANSLYWIPADGDYDGVRNIYAKINPEFSDHDILTGLQLTTDSIKFFEDKSYTESSNNCGYVTNLGEGTRNILTIRTSDTVAQNQLVLIDSGTVFNGHELKNRVVVLGYQAGGYPNLNDNGFKLMLNSIEWAINGDPAPIKAEFKEIFTASAWPNPTNGIFEVIFGKTVNNTVAYIIATDGRIIDFQKINYAESIKFDLSSMESGIYIIRFSGPEEINNLKIALKK